MKPLLLICLAFIANAAMSQQRIPISIGNVSGAWNPPSWAADGDPTTLWNSGGYPTQWIDIDLGYDRTVKQIRMLPAQIPDGYVHHSVYGRSNAGAWVGIGGHSGYASDSNWINVFTNNPTPVRYLVVQTTASPSWVAWREFEVFEPSRPSNGGDVVGRDLDVPGLGWIGHVGLWDGSRVIEMLKEAQVSQSNTYENFMSRSAAWEPARTNIP